MKHEKPPSSTSASCLASHSRIHPPLCVLTSLSCSYRHLPLSSSSSHSLSPQSKFECITGTTPSPPTVSYGQMEI